MREAATCSRAGDSALVYRLPMEVFPGFWGYAHLLLAGQVVALVDVGSGFGRSDEDLQAGMEQVRQSFGERVGWEDITHILITHGHIDHFGGLRPVLERTNALLVIHGLDSLDKLLPWCGEIRVTLGGHEAPIEDLCGRILAIKGMHEGRLRATLDLLQRPKTILEVAEALFGQLGGYDELLGIEEAGTHVEYLLQHSQARIENWRVLEKHSKSPMRYIGTDLSAMPLKQGSA